MHTRTQTHSHTPTVNPLEAGFPHGQGQEVLFSEGPKIPKIEMPLSPLPSGKPSRSSVQLEVAATSRSRISSQRFQSRV